ncbi:MAG TPA: MurT ligase domain-containing protein [Acidimicrobiales bacterium]|nr:MurT ligase domain-containing protein [Acidimicrobiales bacterium]
MVGGRATLAVDPRALDHLAAGRRVAVVSGTNGKTTTTSLLAAALATSGPVATNLQGANLPPGLAAALAGAPPGGLAALEVDEAWLGRVVDATRPAVAVLLNLSRDQLDRNNEVRHLAASWRATFAGRPATTVVANADDPLVVHGAGAADHVVWVGAGQPWTADASGCPRCGNRVLFGDEAAPVGSEVEAGGAAAADAGAGARAADPGVAWRCSVCDLRRPPLAVRIDHDGTTTTVRSTDGWAVPLSLALPGRANRANAALALAAAARLGVDPAAAAAALARTAEVVGRYRTVAARGADARLLLSKNPAGWLEVLDVLAPPPAPVVVAINARIADGRDPSWLWDVPFERLAGRRVVATGERSRDLAVRLHYAEVDHVRVDDLLEAVAVAAADPAAATASGRPAVDVVGNYTAFQQLRSRLGVGA